MVHLTHFEKILNRREIDCRLINTLKMGRWNLKCFEFIVLYMSLLLMCDIIVTIICTFFRLNTFARF